MAEPVIKMNISGDEQIREGFAKAPEFTQKQLERALRASLETIEKNAVDDNFQFKTSRSKRTGELQNSFIEGKEIDGLSASIGPTVKYAKWVHDGTSPYTIRANTAEALYWSGAPHPVKTVRHPGIDPNPFMPRIAEAARPEIVNKHFATVLERIAKKIANNG